MRHGRIVAVLAVLIVGAFVFTVTAAAYPLIGSLWPGPPSHDPWVPEGDPETDSDVSEEPEVAEEPEEPQVRDPGKPPFTHPQPVNVPGFPSEDLPTCRFCV